MFGREKALKIIQQVLQACCGNTGEVLLLVEEKATTRFANNGIHQNMSERNASLIVRLFHGQSMGTAITNRLDETGIEEVMARANANAAASAPDPDYPGLPGPSDYQKSGAFDDETAGYSSKARALAVEEVCRLAQERGLNASGAFSTGCGEIAIGNSQDLFAYDTSTHADFQTTVMSEDSSGRAHASAWKASRVPVWELGREAIEKAEWGKNPHRIEPGDYTVVLEPYVTEDLLNMLNYHGMGALAVQEGRSWMNNRINQNAMSNLISIWDDGLDPDGMPAAFDFEGVPKQRVDIVKAGQVIGPVYDHYTAAKEKRASTGHALPPTMGSLGPLAANLFVAPGDSSVEDMIRSTTRGLYINRFWYTRLVHPRDCVITGMTRDGIYMIEDGQLAYPVKNMRFTQSYVEALANVEAVSQERRLLSSELGSLSVLVPALKIDRFTFTGVTA